MSREFLLLAALTVACSDGGTVESAAPEPTPEPPPVETQVSPSKKARVKFKGPRWATDLSRALELDQICTELGRLDCVKDVHLIALGGTEPYRLGVREPLAVAPIAGGNAVDRVALNACVARVDADFEKPDDALFFGALAQSSGLADEDLAPAAEKLYDRLLLRDAQVDEVAALVAFAEDVRADSDNPARDWAILSCFAVASSLESLFY